MEERIRVLALGPYRRDQGMRRGREGYTKGERVRDNMNAFNK